MLLWMPRLVLSATESDKGLAAAFTVRSRPPKFLCRRDRHLQHPVESGLFILSLEGPLSAAASSHNLPARQPAASALIQTPRIKRVRFL